MLEILAQTTPDAPANNGGGSSMIMLVPIVIIAALYFLMFSTKRKQDKQRQQLIEGLKKGDRVQTIGGILGTVVNVESNEVLVKVDESSNTKLHFARSAIHRVLNDDKTKADSK